MNTRQLIAGVGMLALMTGPLTAARSQAEIVRPPGAAYAVSEGITVRGHGHGEVKVKPDIALITIAVTTQSKDQAEAVSQNAARTTDDAGCACHAARHRRQGHPNAVLYAPAAV